MSFTSSTRSLNKLWDIIPTQWYLLYLYWLGELGIYKLLNILTNIRVKILCNSLNPECSYLSSLFEFNTFPKYNIYVFSDSFVLCSRCPLKRYTHPLYFDLRKCFIFFNSLAFHISKRMNGRSSSSGCRDRYAKWQIWIMHFCFGFLWEKFWLFSVR